MISVLLKEQGMRFLAAAGFLLIILHSLCGQTTAGNFAPIDGDQDEFLLVKVFRVVIDPGSMQPAVVLAGPLEERGFFILIDQYVSNAILSEMQGIDHQRPQTHDLLENFIRKADLNIQRVIITHIEQGIYYATILIERGGSLIEIDARPSDSLVMALKFNAPVFVSEKLFKEASIPLTKQKEVEEDYGLTFQELTPSLAQAFSYGSTRGVLVSAVREESHAEKIGIERGDIFVEIGGVTVEDVTTIRNALKKSKTTLEAKIFRKARFISMTIHLN